MQKLKIRQYWTKQTNKPWYVIRYGNDANQYVTANNFELPRAIKAAIFWGKIHSRTNG